MILCFRCWW